MRHLSSWDVSTPIHAAHPVSHASLYCTSYLPSSASPSRTPLRPPPPAPPPSPSRGRQRQEARALRRTGASTRSRPARAVTGGGHQHQHQSQRGGASGREMGRYFLRKANPRRGRPDAPPPEGPRRRVSKSGHPADSGSLFLGSPEPEPREQRAETLCQRAEGKTGADDRPPPSPISRYHAPPGGGGQVMLIIPSRAFSPRE